VTRPSLAPTPVARAVELARQHLDRRPLLIVSDFDGTLSKIVMDPWGASILPLGRRALRRLAGLPEVHVVVLSGRTATDVAGRVRVGNVTYLGNHGMERAYLPRRGRAEKLVATVDESPAPAVEAAERVAGRMPELVAEDWLVVEHKPPAVALHYRSAPDIDAAAARVRDAVDRLDSERVLQRYPGRRVLELRPKGATAKGQTLARLIEELEPRSVFMLGDDVSDAEAFHVLRESRRDGRTDGIAVAVQARAEAPKDVLEAADLVLASPAAATRFLSALARTIAAQSARRATG
jgi:trehalose 6-phosphate phosphatase